jgi:hypothetical protein
MSFRSASKENTRAKTFSNPPNWIRNPSWPQLPSVQSTDNTFIGLHRVYENGNFLALTAAGNYTVDWGDGSASENYTANTVAYKEYSFNSSTLNGTNAPVTLTDSGDLITRTAHGYQNGNTVSFYNIVNTTGLTQAAQYYVINATADTFQVSQTNDGSVVTLTTDGTATLLPYKMAVVTVTPQSGQTFTTIDLHRKHNKTGLGTYDSGFVDIVIAGSNLTTVLIATSAAQTVFPSIYFNSLEQVNILSTGTITGYGLFKNCYNLSNCVNLNFNSITSAYQMFYVCRYLSSVPLFNIASCGDTSYMFGYCSALKEIPLFNTQSVQYMNNMFEACHLLETIPLLNTQAAIQMSAMFMNCSGLKTIPLLNTANNTTMVSMFSSCSLLEKVPLLNTNKVTSFNNCFALCRGLKKVPLLDTSNATSMSGMLSSCPSLVEVPLFNLVKAQNMSFMFDSCDSLSNVPLFNTVAATNMAGMFGNCYSLREVPLFTTNSVTNMSQMFNRCFSLTSVPDFNATNVTNFSSMFSNANSIIKATLSGVKYAIDYGFCKLSEAELTNIINALGRANSQNLSFNVSNNHGAVTPISRSATTTAGSKTITITNTASLEVGMQWTGTGSPATTAIACTFTDAGDLVNLTAHGLENGDQVSFATITTTTGITNNTIYFVVNKTADTFQVAATSGGAALALTSNGSGTLRYRSVIESIVTNTSVTVSRPATSSGTNTLAFRTLPTQIALLKGWSVTG